MKIQEINNKTQFENSGIDLTKADIFYELYTWWQEVTMSLFSNPNVRELPKRKVKFMKIGLGTEYRFWIYTLFFIRIPFIRISG